MKICDIYPYLYAYLEMLDYVRLEDDQFDRQIFHYLSRINVELPKAQEIRSSSKAKFRSMYESGKKTEDLGQKVSRNLFNQKRTSNERDSNVVCSGTVLKNAKSGVLKSGAFNFLTNGFSNTLRSSTLEDEELSGRSEIHSKSNSASKKEHLNVRRFEENSFVAGSSAEDGSLEKNVSLDDSDVLLGQANDELIRTNGSLNGESGLSRKLARQTTRSEPPKNSRKRFLENDKIRKTEIKLLIKEFKSRESIKKAKRRRRIRESMKFDVETRIS